MRWKKARLGDICVRVITGKTPPTSITEYFDGSIKWITPSDFDKKELGNSNRTITQKAIDENKAPLFSPNSILINCIGNIGKVGILRTKGSSNQQITAIELAGNIDVDFFYYQLLQKKDQLINLGNNSVVPILNSTSLKRLDVSFPDLPTQQHIAAVLDKADALRQQNRQLLNYYDELLQSTFIELFGDPVTNEKGWKVRKLGEVSEKVQIGPFGSLLHQEDYISGGIPLINPTHIKDLKVLPNKDLSITNTKFDTLRNYHLKQGDVIMGRRGEMGRCAIITKIEDGWLCGTGSLFIRPLKTINSFYLVYLLSNEKIKTVFESESLGITMANLNAKIVNNLKINVPPINIQNKFASMVEKIERQKALAQAALNDSEALFEGLLAGYFGEK
jgi:type I restriction enzyme, S subunit